MEQVLAFLNSIAAFLEGEMVLKIMGSLAALGVIDTVCRVLKTQRPKDVLRLVALALVKGAQLLSAAANLALKVSAMIDKIIPQNSVQPVVEQKVAVEVKPVEQPPNA